VLLLVKVLHKYMFTKRCFILTFSLGFAIMKICFVFFSIFLKFLFGLVIGIDHRSKLHL
jgi:hypothetical protein